MDVINVASAHFAAKIGNYVPWFAQNITPAHDDPSEGVLQSVDQPGGEHFLRVHFPDQLLQFLGAALNFMGKGIVGGARVVLALPVIQLIGLLLNLRMNVQKLLQELLALQLFFCHGCSFRIDIILSNSNIKRTKVRIMIIPHECLFVKRRKEIFRIFFEISKSVFGNERKNEILFLFLLLLLILLRYMALHQRYISVTCNVTVTLQPCKNPRFWERTKEWNSFSISPSSSIA